MFLFEVPLGKFPLLQLLQGNWYHFAFMKNLSLMASLLSLVARKLRFYGLNFCGLAFPRPHISIPPQFYFIPITYISVLL